MIIPDPDWWRHAVVYQVYLRSFADGNGDGTGDLRGLRERLGHLVALGVDAVWLNPWYRSPMRDGGYDVEDHRDIHPGFGTLAEAEAFVTEAHDAGIRVVVDLVPNHTSDRHQWFRQALESAPGSRERNRYLFRDGRGPGGNRPPSDWRSVFGGPAWERVDDGQWYLHLFDVTQPDLDWRNPEVRADFDGILRFWLDRGVDGFRVDVAHGMMKAPTFPDVGDRFDGSHWAAEGHPYWDLDEVHEIARGWRRILDGYPDRMMVAEAWVHADALARYLRPDEYHQCFGFDLLDAEWDATEFSDVVRRSIRDAAQVGSTPTWVLSNHDVMRPATRYGLPPGTDVATWSVTGPHHVLDADLGRARARAAALVTLGLPGSVYVYQGEELGLPEVWDLPTDVLDDPRWERSGHTEKGRDGCRVPIPWEAGGPSFGFGTGPGWLPQPATFAALAVSEQEKDPESFLALYRRAIALRSARLRGDEEADLVDRGPEVLAFRRGSGIECILNMGVEPVPLPAGEVLVASRPGAGPLLEPDTAVWLVPDTGADPGRRA